MTPDTHWLSRVTPVTGISHKQLVNDVGGLDPYEQHQALWKLFNVSREERTNRAEFLFRTEQQNGLPVFYVLSRRQPQDRTGLWRVESKIYQPDIQVGDRLSFKLRVNPVVHDKKERSDIESTQWLERRALEQKKQKTVTKKRIRHDVVMDAKRRIGWKDLPEDSRPPLAHVAFEAGACWLRDREERLGCSIDNNSLRVDGYQTWRQRGRKNIELSTLDFEGTLVVRDPVHFLNTLLKGVGRAKSFGCGLLLVRRLSGYNGCVT